MSFKPITGPQLRGWRLGRGMTVDEASVAFNMGRTTWWRAEANGPRFAVIWGLALAWYDHTHPREKV